MVNNLLPPPDPSSRVPQPASQAFSPKSFRRAWLFSLFLGVVGADRFYLEKRYSGLVKLFTVGGLFIWWLIDLWILLIAPKDRDGLPLKKPDGPTWMYWVGAVVPTVLVLYTLNAMGGGL